DLSVCRRNQRPLAERKVQPAVGRAQNVEHGPDLARRNDLPNDVLHREQTLLALLDARSRRTSHVELDEASVYRGEEVAPYQGEDCGPSGGEGPQRTPHEGGNPPPPPPPAHQSQRQPAPICRPEAFEGAVERREGARHQPPPGRAMSPVGVTTHLGAEEVANE